MPRIRSVKPDFFKHWALFKAEKDSGLPIRLAYEGLWTVADKEGRFRFVPEQLKLEVLPYDEVDFKKVLDILEQNGWIIKYENGGKEYAYIPTFSEHQRITGSEAKGESKLPAPPLRNNLGNTLETPWKHLGNTLETIGNNAGTKDAQICSPPKDIIDSLSTGNTLETPWKHLGNTLDDRRGEREEELGNDIHSPPLREGEVFWDVEAELLKHQKIFEAICIAAQKNKDVGLESLRKYHLHLQEKELYPRSKKSLFAGFEKWLRNEKKINNGPSQTDATGSKSGTSEARTREIERW